MWCPHCYFISFKEPKAMLDLILISSRVGVDANIVIVLSVNGHNT